VSVRPYHKQTPAHRVVESLSSLFMNLPSGKTRDLHIASQGLLSPQISVYISPLVVEK